MKNFIKKVAYPILFIYLLILTPYSLANDEEQVFYYLQDHLGGIDVVVDENGNIVERKDYLPYGEERIVNNDTEEDYGYTGKEEDIESGLYYYGQRYYDPKIGRFTQIDPLVLSESEIPLSDILANPQALNGYSYALNNPMRYVDERGEYQKDVHYDLTYYLSTSSGLRNDQSKMVTFQDQYVDDNPETAPSLDNLINNYQVIVDNHFQSRGESAKRLEQALESGNLSDFGAALHTYQDSYSHEGLNPFTHIGKMHEPDLTYKSPIKAYLMAKSTFFNLRRLNALTNGIGKLTADEYRKQTIQIWHNISKDVKSYLEKDSKTGTEIEKNARISEEKKH